MVMEWLDGRLLRHIMNEEKKLPVRSGQSQADSGVFAMRLRCIHAVMGVVHRDLKPGEHYGLAGSDEVRYLIDFWDCGERWFATAYVRHTFRRAWGRRITSRRSRCAGSAEMRAAIFILVGVMLYEMLTGTVPLMQGRIHLR